MDRITPRLRRHLVVSAAALALITLLLVACSSGGVNGAKAEASLREYISTLTPETSGFPIGAGPPRVREKSCTRLPKSRLPARGRIPTATTKGITYLRIPKGTTWWSCVVTVGKHYKTGVLFAIKSSGEPFLLGQMPQQGTKPAPPLPPATVYQGGP